MKRFWKLAGVVALVAILGVAAVGAVAYAQDDGSGGPFDFHGKFREALANILGISVEEYDAAVEQAQSQVVDEALAEGWLTEEQAELLQWRMDQAPGFGMRDMGRGFGKFGHGMMGGQDNLVSIAADKLGMKLTELLTELQDGKSIADVADEMGVDTQVIVDAYLAQVKENLDEAVAAGRITQNQADYQMEQVEQRVTDQLDNMRMDGFHGGGRRGGQMGFPGPGGF
jgi:polyhydroxyalkanoate synthesis regulator phasin